MAVDVEVEARARRANVHPQRGLSFERRRYGLRAPAADQPSRQVVAEGPWAARELQFGDRAEQRPRPAAIDADDAPVARQQPLAVAQQQSRASSGGPTVFTGHPALEAPRLQCRLAGDPQFALDVAVAKEDADRARGQLFTGGRGAQRYALDSVACGENNGGDEKADERSACGCACPAGAGTHGATIYLSRQELRRFSGRRWPAASLLPPRPAGRAFRPVSARVPASPTSRPSAATRARRCPVRSPPPASHSDTRARTSASSRPARRDGASSAGRRRRSRAPSPHRSGTS